MNALMHSQMSWVYEALVAEATLKRTIACMNALVHWQMSWLREAFVAEPTRKRTIACMNALMNSQTSWLCEVLVAEATYKWTIAFVNALVHSQISWLREALVAEPTHKRASDFAITLIYCTCIFRYLSFHLQVEGGWRLFFFRTKWDANVLILHTKNTWNERQIHLFKVDQSTTTMMHSSTLHMHLQTVHIYWRAKLIQKLKLHPRTISTKHLQAYDIEKLGSKIHVCRCAVIADRGTPRRPSSNHLATCSRQRIASDLHVRPI